MASLDKMAIRGIRSFDDKSINIIQFFTPLTVIVGYNGSGKTTIIECLKYATTGDLPPNTKGGAFVHDPKMATTNEVKAQVRLRFYSTNKTRINCVRNLQVSVKKAGGLTMKTLEGLLQVDDENASKNKRAVLSTRCAELDEEVPRLLGVSRAVLENVIFCHQEESNWPLAEPASLKKKFDDIFEATRYTKALDNIKVLRKERTVELKVAKAELEGLKNDRDRADAIKEKRKKLQTQLAGKEAQLDELNDDIRKLTQENKDLYDKAVRFRETVNKAETLESKISIHEGNLQTLKDNMTPLDDSEEELKRRDDSFQDHVRAQERRRAGHTRKVSEKKDELSRIDGKISKLRTEKGALEKDREIHAETVKRREDQVRRISRELGIKGFDLEGLSEEQIQTFLARLEEDASRFEGEANSLKNKNAAKENELSNAYQDRRSALRSKETTRENLLKSNRRLKERIKALDDELDALRVDERDIESASRDLTDLQAKLENEKRSLAEADFEDKLRAKAAEIRELDDRREEHTAELNALNRHADFRAKLGMKRTEVTDKKREAEALLSRNSEALTRYIGREPEASTIEADVARAIQAKERELTAAERADQDKNKALQHVESTLSFARQQLKDKTAQAAALEADVKEQLEDADSLESAIADCDAEIEEYQSELSVTVHARELFGRFKVHGEKNHQCMGCGRGITDAEMDAFLKHINESIQRADPARQADKKRELAAWQERRRLLQGLLPKDAQAKLLRTKEMPKLETAVAADQDKLTAASAEAEKTASTLEAAKAVVRELTSLRRVAADVARLTAEVATLDRDIATLENDLSSTGTARTGDDVQREINDLADSVKRLKREQDNLTRDRDVRKTQLATLERDVHRAELAAAEKRQEYAKRESLVQRKAEAEAELKEGVQSIQRIEDEVQEGAKGLRRAKEELDAARTQNDAQLSEANERARKGRHAVEKLSELEQAVNRYSVERGEAKLKDCEDKIADMQQQRAAVEGEIEEVEKEAANIAKDINQSAAVQRNIKDNLRYFQLQRDLAKLRAELDTLDLESASHANRVWTTRYNDSKQRENELNGQAAHLGGEISSLRSEIKGREDELKEDYKNVHKRYTDKLIHVKTSEMANNDLEKYGKALDNAIMRYHSIKMEEINEQIRYLWGKTYQGTDIDTISIRSDNENAKGNRSYNYRVVMLKDNVELDMRGRCSAGQKVLASIIIRLALADSFGNSCGILALDEPTTNLDQENIEALAKSLSDLIKERQNSQFQLIVITHDEEFLTRLGQNDVLDYYWRVSRNTQQKSIIERERIK